MSAELLQRAQAAGLLPAGATLPDSSPEQRPWPVLLMVAVGAWFVALPVLALVGLLLVALRDSKKRPL